MAKGLLYVAMGIASGLAWLALGHGKVAIGASGAIMGITGVYLVLYPRNEVTVFWSFGWWYYGVTEIAGGWVVLCEIVFNVIGWLMPIKTGVAYESHLGGLLAGMATGVILLGTGLVKSSFYEENLLQLVGWQRHTKRRRRRRRKPRLPVESGDQSRGRSGSFPG